MRMRAETAQSIMPAAQLIIRTFVLGLAIIHTGTLVANLTQTWDTFNPSYKGHYIRQQLLRPLIGLGIAGILILCETPLASWLMAVSAP
jgi:hypothetical protein